MVVDDDEAERIAQLCIVSTLTFRTADLSDGEVTILPVEQSYSVLRVGNASLIVKI